MSFDREKLSVCHSIEKSQREREREKERESAEI